MEEKTSDIKKLLSILKSQMESSVNDILAPCGKLADANQPDFKA